ncbi:MAG: hypothetical protein U9R43_11315 [Thermodesulfobacteriota bacterium]|nr:hypothetical protein [Thermodesulfobacteriota bacterium]
MSKFIIKAGLLLVIFALSMQSAEAFEQAKGFTETWADGWKKSNRHA